MTGPGDRAEAPATRDSSKTTIAVVGAGTMGAGIAQVAALAGHPVLLYDGQAGAADVAVSRIQANVKSLRAKDRVDVDPDDLALTAVTGIADLARAGVVIEAIVENLEAKQKLFAALEDVTSADCLLASNTSSFSPAALAKNLQRPGRLVGLHFFNPVPLMLLVEVVSGALTAPQCADTAAELATSWGKTVVRSAPTPGFIVNRVARPFYAEALRLFEEHAADPARIDAVMTGAAGFRLGPFALMDLIGHDVNEAATRSVWTAFSYDTRFTPSIAQRTLVEIGWLGRKSGRGFYDYTDGRRPPSAAPAPAQPAPAEVVEHAAHAFRTLLQRSGVPVLEGAGAGGEVELPCGAALVRTNGRTATEIAADSSRDVVVVDRTLSDTDATAIAIAASDGCPPAAIDQACGLLQAAGLDVHIIDDVPALVVARTVAMLVNLAVDALHGDVASADDIDTAMRLGTNYPLGPLEWGQRWGLADVVDILDHLARIEGGTRYRASTLLRRRAQSGGSLR